MKRLINFILCVIVIVLCAVGVSAVTTHGKCGKDVYWTVDFDAKTLTISGTGVAEFDRNVIDELEKYEDYIIKFIVSEGITELADDLSLGSWHWNVEEIVLPSTLKKIGANALPHVETLLLPADIEYIDPAGLFANEYIINGINGVGKNFCTIEGVLYSSDKKRLVKYPYSSYSYNRYDTIIIPDYVAIIGEYAFDRFYASEIVLGQSVHRIESYALNLMSSCYISIPGSVQFIEESAITGSLDYISVSEDNLYYRSVGGVLYTKYLEKLILFPEYLEITEYSIPEGCKEIGKSAFWGNDYLTKIYAPDSVTIVKTGAFDDCYYLEAVYFAGDKPTFSNDVFGSNSIMCNVTNIYYPKGAKGWDSIDLGFLCSDEHKEIKLIEYEASPHTCDYKIKSTVASTCAKAGYNTYTCSECGESYTEELPLSTDHNWIYVDTTPATCTEKGSKNYVCSVCSAPKVDDISPTGHNYGEWQLDYNSVMNGQGIEIRYCTNADCSAYQTREVEVVTAETHEHTETQEPAKSVSQSKYSGQCGDGAYWSLDIESGVLTIDGSGDMWDFAMYDLDEEPHERPWGSPYRSWTVDNSAYIKKVIIGDSITSIGDYSFASCHNLTSVEIGASVFDIGRSAFDNTRITQIELPDSLKVLGPSALMNTNLVSIVIPSNVVWIESFSLAYCDYLENVYIPLSIVYIGDDLFGIHHSTTEKLPTIYYDGTKDDWKNIQIVTTNGNERLVNAETVVFQDEYSKEEIIEDLSNNTCNHEWHWSSSWSPTCDTVGYKWYICGICFEEKTEEIPATGHKLGLWSFKELDMDFAEVIIERKCTNSGCKFAEEEAFSIIYVIAAVLLIVAIVISIILSVKNKKLKSKLKQSEKATRQAPRIKKKTCPVCGQYVEDTELFCPVCGTKLEKGGE